MIRKQIIWNIVFIILCGWIFAQDYYWIEFPSPVIEKQLEAIYMLSSTDGWIVGANGIILHYDGNKWSRKLSPTTKNLYTIHMISSDRGWIGGEEGTLLYYDGGNWKIYKNAPLTNNNYLSIFLVTENEGWAVGTNGLTAYYNGSSWILKEKITTVNLNSIYMLSAKEGWAVGFGGIVAHFFNGNWKVEDITTEPVFFESVKALSSTKVWVGSSNGDIYYYNGIEWKRIITIPNFTLLSEIYVLSEDNIWAVGSQGIVRYNGNSWQKVESSYETLISLYMISNNDGWAVGTDGKILCYTLGPVISSLFPPAGKVGDQVVISGKGFGQEQNGGKIFFSNNVEATSVIWTDKMIIITVPEGACSGNIVIVNKAKTSNGVRFSLGPLITQIIPSSGQIGDTVNILGFCFGEKQGTSMITFNGVTAAPKQWGDLQIITTIPKSATTGEVIITTSKGNSEGFLFVITSMEINSIKSSNNVLFQSYPNPFNP